MDITLQLRENLAWAAGIVDGEGSFTSSYERPHFILGQASEYDESGWFAKPFMIVRFSALLDKLGIAHKIYHHKPKAQGGRSTWNLNVHKFEAYQALAVFLWKWLGPVKKLQYKRTIQVFLNK